MQFLEKVASRGETKRMRYLYLLAASLLTGLAIPVSALPQLSIIQSETSEQSSLSTVSEKIVPDVQVSPELHQQVSQASPSSSVNPDVQIDNHQLVSGSQLYYQRLTALKAEQTYTRSANNLQSLWKSTRKPQLTYEDWKNLLVMEAKAMAVDQGRNHLSILVGDSLSMWFPREKLPTGELWLNQGISGDTSTGILKRLSAFSQTKPDVIYLMAGVNDLRKGVGDTIVLHNHRQIIHNLRHAHPHAQIIVQSILPTRLTTIPNSRIRRINNQLAFIAKQEGAYYLDIHNWFADVQGNLREDLTTDGLHLSEQGYDVWRAAIQQMELRNTVLRMSQQIKSKK